MTVCVVRGSEGEIVAVEGEVRAGAAGVGCAVGCAVRVAEEAGREMERALERRAKEVLAGRGQSEDAAGGVWTD